MATLKILQSWSKISHCHSRIRSTILNYDTGHQNKGNFPVSRAGQFIRLPTDFIFLNMPSNLFS